MGICKKEKRDNHGGISDINALSSAVLEDSKKAARGVTEAMTADFNRWIREGKKGRKAKGLVLEEKERERSLLTELGTLHLPWEYQKESEGSG